MTSPHKRRDFLEHILVGATSLRSPPVQLDHIGSVARRLFDWLLFESTWLDGWRCCKVQIVRNTWQDRWLQSLHHICRAATRIQRCGWLLSFRSGRGAAIALSTRQPEIRCSHEQPLEGLNTSRHEPRIVRLGLHSCDSCSSLVSIQDSKVFAMSTVKGVHFGSSTVKVCTGVGSILSKTGTSGSTELSAAAQRLVQRLHEL